MKFPKCFNAVPVENRIAKKNWSEITIYEIHFTIARGLLKSQLFINNESWENLIELLFMTLNHLLVTSEEDKTVPYLAADTLLTDYRIFEPSSLPTLSG